MVKIFATIQSAKIGLAGIYFQTKLTFSEISIQNAVNKLMYKTDIAIQKYNHQGLYNTYTPSSQNWRYVY